MQENIKESCKNEESKMFIASKSENVQIKM